SSPGADAQSGTDFEVRQPVDSVSVTLGQNLTLTCTVSGLLPLGPVQWLKGSGSNSQTVYDQRNPSPRILRAVNGSNTDFTILIPDVGLGDAGTYYCVKFKKSNGRNEELRRGGGTNVSVQAMPSKPVVSGPSQRAVPGQSVLFTCRAGGFLPRSIEVTWLKNNHPVNALQTNITSGPSDSPSNMSSTVNVTLSKDDVLSELTCKVKHETLQDPLMETYRLGQVLQVPPEVSVDAKPQNSVEANKTVRFTCSVQDFYPGNVSITWLENETRMNVTSIPQPTKTHKGLFQLTSTVTVQAVEEKNGFNFTCRVVHEAQEPIYRTATLQVT
ncbi:SIRBL protein, partial [Alectura lathami]|nr:SIRBL protein [Alectura lathami]